MSTKTIRLLAGFLAGFVLLSYAPALPELIAKLDVGNGLQLPAVTDTTLMVIGGLVALLGLVVMHRRQRQALAQPIPRPSPSRALARPSAEQPLRRAMPEHSGPYPTIASPLQIRLRAAVEKGDRIAVLARRHNLSIDAVRLAVGTTATSSSSEPRASTSFRSHAPSLPAKPKARPVAQRGSSYQSTI